MAKRNSSFALFLLLALALHAGLLLWLADQGFLSKSAIDPSKIPFRPVEVKLGAVPVLAPNMPVTPPENTVEEVQEPSVMENPETVEEPELPVAVQESPIVPPGEEVPVKKELPPLVQTYITKPSARTNQEAPFVQQYGATGSTAKQMEAASDLGQLTDAQKQIVRSYEQLLSVHMAKFQVYPPSAAEQKIEGKGVVRIRIDRVGNVRFYEVAESTGNGLLDSALKSMVKRADPMPPVPSDYPQGSVLEFLLPVAFRVKEGG